MVIQKLKEMDTEQEFRKKLDNEIKFKDLTKDFLN